MSEFIFMLTYNDKTIANALDVYQEISETGLIYVGFKDVGLPFDELKKLTNKIKNAGQKALLEVVSERKEDELRSARAAVDLGVDYLLGGTHAEEVCNIIAGKPIKYFPFPGNILGHPSLLRGSIDEIVESARKLVAIAHVDGLDLLAYRYDGDVEELCRAVLGNVDKPVIAAGSINSEERIKFVTNIGMWGYTIGSAFHDKAFLPDKGNTIEKVKYILDFDKKLSR
jgi:hypothetical protein